MTKANRDEDVMDLNKVEIDGLIISPQVGGVGHTLYDANNMIFMGSLYSINKIKCSFEKTYVFSKKHCLG
jgi:hypothetical protein